MSKRRAKQKNTFHRCRISRHCRRVGQRKALQKNMFSSWKIRKGPQIVKKGRPGAKLLEGYGGVSEIEQPCYNTC